MDDVKTAWDLVKDERQRQLEILEYDADRDDRYTNGELAIAAACYLVDELDVKVVSANGSDAWPWASGDKRERLDRIRKIVIGVTLGMAEIDRELRRLEKLDNEKRKTS